MKKIILLISLSICLYVSHAQLEAEWFTAYGDNSTDLARNVTIDKQGNTYIIGYTTKNKGNTVNPKMTTMTFLVKYDVKGQLKWSKEIDSETGDEGKTVCTDEQGNIYICGIFSNTIRLDGVNTITDSKDANTYIAKYDTNGNFLWYKILRAHQETTNNQNNIQTKEEQHNEQGEEHHDEHADEHQQGNQNGHNHFHQIINQITDMKTDNENNFYICGFFNKSIDFDPSENEEIITATDATDVFLAKYDQEGNLLWVKTLTSKGGNKANSLTIDSKNNVYITGSFIQNATLGKLTVEGDGGNGIFIAKLNQNGKEQWIKKITNTKNNSGNYIYCDKKDNLYIAGSISSRTEFNEINKVLTVKENASNIFIAKLNENGEYQWVKAFKGQYYSSAEGILTDTYGNIYVSGYFIGSLEAKDNETVYSSGKEDGFIMMLDSDATMIYIYPLGGIDHDRASRMDIYNDNSLIVIGAHNGPFYINPEIFADYVEFQGTTDAFFIKFGHIFEKPKIKINEVTSNSIALEWDTQPYVVGYEIILLQGKYSAPYYVGNNSIVLNPLQPATAYIIRARAYNDSKHSKQSEVKIVTPPVANEAKNIKSNEFTASWTKTKTEKFKLYISTKEDFSVCLPEYNGINVTENSIKIINLQANTIYYYRLQTETGNYSNTISVTTK